MQNQLTISVVQMLQQEGHPEVNHNKLWSLLSDFSQKTDLIVLPEMWNTGFITNPSALYNNAYEQGLQVMRQVAQRYNAAVYGSLIRHSNNAYTNTGVFVYPFTKTTEVTYDKHHLFVPGGEARLFTPGKRRVTAEYKGWKFRVCVCYDLRFPVWLRYTPNMPYDVLLCCANWPEVRSYEWKTLLAATAIHNQAYVVGCNRVGNAPKELYYAGDSAIYNPIGQAVAQVTPHQEGVVHYTIEREKLEKYRAKFNHLDNQDPFALLCHKE